MFLVSICWSDRCISSSASTEQRGSVEKPTSTVWRTLCFSSSRWERGSWRHQALTLKASLACHFLMLSKMWIFPSTEHNIYHLHSAAGRGPGWVNIMYGHGGSSWRLKWIGLNVELSSCDSTWDNKAAHYTHRQTGGGCWAPWWAAKTW